MITFSIWCAWFGIHAMVFAIAPAPEKATNEECRWLLIGMAALLAAAILATIAVNA